MNNLYRESHLDLIHLFGTMIIRPPRPNLNLSRAGCWTLNQARNDFAFLLGTSLEQGTRNIDLPSFQVGSLRVMIVLVG